MDTIDAIVTQNRIGNRKVGPLQVQGIDYSKPSASGLAIMEAIGQMIRGHNLFAACGRDSTFGIHMKWGRLELDNGRVCEFTIGPAAARVGRMITQGEAW